MPSVKLLSFDHIKLVCIAIVIATPIAYYAMRQWLGIVLTGLTPVQGSFYWRVLWPL